MEEINRRPLKHVLVCVNERGQFEECCSNTGSLEIFRELKNFIREKGLSSSIWVTKTGCLGFCNDKGATVVIYPDQKWFKKVTKNDLPAIKKEILNP